MPSRIDCHRAQQRQRLRDDARRDRCLARYQSAACALRPCMGKTGGGGARDRNLQSGQEAVCPVFVRRFGGGGAGFFTLKRDAAGGRYPWFPRDFKIASSRAAGFRDAGKIPQRNYCVRRTRSDRPLNQPFDLGTGDMRHVMYVWVDAFSDRLSPRATAATITRRCSPRSMPGSILECGAARGASRAIARRLAPYALVWEKLAEAARETETFNLDKRPFVLSLFADLAARGSSL
jgi:hypothetical protein